MKYYQTQTREDYDDLMNFLEKRGFSWFSGDRPTDLDEWDDCKEDTVIVFYEHDKKIIYTSKQDLLRDRGIEESDIIVWKKEEAKEIILSNENSKLNNPQHYKINGQDSMKLILDIVKENSTSVEETIYLFNTLKYLIRFKRKNGKEDLLKAKDYLNRLLEEVQEIEK